MTQCPACGSPDLEGFFRLDEVPTNSCLLLEDQDVARSFPRGRLDLATCRTCGFITNRAFDPALAEYSARYEETQSFSPTFAAFGRSLASEWVRDHGLEGRHVLEIGCGKGEFLAWMVEAGAGSGTGIDPGVHPERITGDTADRIEWIADLYDDRYLHLEADAIVCRHTLEHISPVRDFLARIRRHVGSRDIPVLFELPDTMRVLDEVAFWDLYYEHCSYFTAGSLARLFRRCGFEVADVKLAYDDQYLLLEASAAVDSDEYPSPLEAEEEVDEVLDRVDGFAARYDEMVRTWTGRLTAVRARGGRTVLWGGGSKAVSFLSVPTLSGGVDAVTDINPNKQGRYLAGAGHEVLAPGQLRDLQPELVVLANPIYLDEVAADLTAMGIECEVAAL
ncbi:MAG: methyltransferase domain-containing protein [Nitriliruptor sp.]|nr:MAG: methyltransferase domain-containing protein [Nitriliruptor sp.]